jgi:hypothetical protein
MFKHLTDFGYKRNAKEAIGFYIAYLILIMISGALLAGALAIIINEPDNFELGLRVGSITAMVITLGVAFLVLKAKKLLGNFGYILLVLLAGILAIFAGGLGGLIPVSYLTTRK